VVEASVIEGQRERVLPVDPGAHRVGRLAVGEVLGKLEDRHQRKAPGSLGRSPANREQVRQRTILHQGLQRIAHPQIRVPRRERSPRDARRLLGHRSKRCGAQ